MPKNNFAADFRAEKSQDGLRRKTNDRRCPLNLGPMILKLLILELAEDSFTLISGSEVTQMFILFFLLRYQDKTKGMDA